MCVGAQMALPSDTADVPDVDLLPLLARRRAHVA